MEIGSDKKRNKLFKRKRRGVRKDEKGEENGKDHEQWLEKEKNEKKTNSKRKSRKNIKERNGKEKK